MNKKLLLLGSTLILSTTISKPMSWLKDSIIANPTLLRHGIVITNYPQAVQYPSNLAKICSAAAGLISHYLHRNCPSSEQLITQSNQLTSLRQTITSLQNQLQILDAQLKASEEHRSRSNQQLEEERRKINEELRSAKEQLIYEGRKHADFRILISAARTQESRENQELRQRIELLTALIKDYERLHAESLQQVAIMAASSSSVGSEQNEGSGENGQSQSDLNSTTHSDTNSSTE